MDPSLIEIIKAAVRSVQGQGLGAGEQRAAARNVLLTLIPSLCPSVVELIIDQLLPAVAGTGACA